MTAHKKLIDKMFMTIKHMSENNIKMTPEVGMQISNDIIVNKIVKFMKNTKKLHEEIYMNRIEKFRSPMDEFKVLHAIFHGNAGYRIEIIEDNLNLMNEALSSSMEPDMSSKRSIESWLRKIYHVYTSIQKGKFENSPYKAIREGDGILEYHYENDERMWPVFVKEVTNEHVMEAYNIIVVDGVLSK